MLEKDNEVKSNSNLSIERVITDDANDCTYNLGDGSEYEFKFDFIICDKVSDTSILIDQETVIVANPNSANWYKILTTGVIVEEILLNNFINALEVIKTGEKREVSNNIFRYQF